MRSAAARRAHHESAPRVGSAHGLERGLEVHEGGVGELVRALGRAVLGADEGVPPRKHKSAPGGASQALHSRQPGGGRKGRAAVDAGKQETLHWR